MINKTKSDSKSEKVNKTKGVRKKMLKKTKMKSKFNKTVEPRLLKEERWAQQAQRLQEHEQQQKEQEHPILKVVKTYHLSERIQNRIAKLPEMKGIKIIADTDTGATWLSCGILYVLSKTEGRIVWASSVGRVPSDIVNTVGTLLAYSHSGQEECESATRVFREYDDTTPSTSQQQHVMTFSEVCELATAPKPQETDTDLMWYKIHIDRYRKEPTPIKEGEMMRMYTHYRTALLLSENEDLPKPIQDRFWKHACPNDHLPANTVGRVVGVCNKGEFDSTKCTTQVQQTFSSANRLRLSSAQKEGNDSTKCIKHMQQIFSPADRLGSISAQKEENDNTKCIEHLQQTSSQARSGMTSVLEKELARTDVEPLKMACNYERQKTLSPSQHSFLALPLTATARSSIASVQDATTKTVKQDCLTYATETTAHTLTSPIAPAISPPKSVQVLFTVLLIVSIIVSFIFNNKNNGTLIQCENKTEGLGESIVPVAMPSTKGETKLSDTPVEFRPDSQSQALHREDIQWKHWYENGKQSLSKTNEKISIDKRANNIYNDLFSDRVGDYYLYKERLDAAAREIALYSKHAYDNFIRDIVKPGYEILGIREYPPAYNIQMKYHNTKTNSRGNVPIVVQTGTANYEQQRETHYATPRGKTSLGSHAHVARDHDSSIIRANTMSVYLSNNICGLAARQLTSTDTVAFDKDGFNTEGIKTTGGFHAVDVHAYHILSHQSRVTSVHDGKESMSSTMKLDQLSQVWPFLKYETAYSTEGGNHICKLNIDIQKTWADEMTFEATSDTKMSALLAASTKAIKALMPYIGYGATIQDYKLPSWCFVQRTDTNFESARSSFQKTTSRKAIARSVSETDLSITVDRTETPMPTKSEVMKQTPSTRGQGAKITWHKQITDNSYPGKIKRRATPRSAMGALAAGLAEGGGRGLGNYISNKQHNKHQEQMLDKAQKWAAEQGDLVRQWQSGENILSRENQQTLAKWGIAGNLTNTVLGTAGQGLLNQGRFSHENEMQDKNLQQQKDLQTAQFAQQDKITGARMANTLGLQQNDHAHQVNMSEQNANNQMRVDDNRDANRKQPSKNAAPLDAGEVSLAPRNPSVQNNETDIPGVAATHATPNEHAPTTGGQVVAANSDAARRMELSVNPSASQVTQSDA